MTNNAENSENQPPNRFIIQHWVKRGVELQNAARFKSALSCFVKALELDPNRVSIWYKVGNCWQNLGLFEDAIASYNACYKRSQTQQNQWFQAASQFCLGQCYVSLQQQDEAVSAYSLAYQLFSQIGNNPHIQQAWDYLNGVGNCWLDEKNYQASIPYYQRLVKLVKSVNNSQHLGWVWHGLGRGFSGDCLDELGLECHRQMLGISRNLSDWEMEGTALYWLAWESWTLKKLADAIAYYEGAMAVYEGREEGKGWVSVILGYLANLYQQTEDFEKAIAVLERRLAMVRDSQDKSREYELLYQIGGVFYKLKDYNGAFDYYQSALEVAQGLTERQPGYEANAYYMLGLMCEFLGRLEEGLANYRQGLRLYSELGNQEWVDYSHQKINSLEELLARRASASRSERNPQLDFLLNVLQATADSKGDGKVVYPLLEQNLDQLNENLADILKAWATTRFKEVPTETAAYIARSILLFGNLIGKFPLGQRAENIEKAIACYDLALEVYTRTAYPEQWAMTQNNLGNAYYYRIRGERAENIEKAIRYSQAALEVYTRNAFPYEWAGTQNNLGNAYKDRIRGERADNIEEAIRRYQAALEVYTRNAFPYEWARTQNNLGNAYNNRIRGERADNIEEAIRRYQAALEVYTRTAFPEDWAGTQNNLGNAYSDRIRGERADNIEEAIRRYQAALEVYTRTAFPQYWAMTQNNLGNAYWSRIRGERSDNIEKAIRCYQAALEVYTRTAFPYEWARTQMNLAAAYSDRIRGERADNIEEAIRCYQAALEVYTRTAFPYEWAMTQYNLAFVYRNRIRGERAENIEKAIRHYQAALEVRTRSAFPEDWAATQNNLGEAYLNHSDEKCAENIERAIVAFKAALEVFTRDQFSLRWATLQNFLGIAYHRRISGDKGENLGKAIQYYKTALEIRTHDSCPEEWAETQYKLGIAYHNHTQGNVIENREQALIAFQACLSSFSKDKDPKKWADAQRLLGYLLFDRTIGNIADNIEKSIAAYQLALTVYTQNKFPEEWADIHNHIGYAYTRRIRGDLADNKEKGIALCEAALTIYTKDKFPEQWAKVQLSLAYSYFQRFLGNRRDNLEMAISIYESALTIFTAPSYPEYWASIQGCLCEVYKHCVFGDREENLQKALQAGEASLMFFKNRENIYSLGIGNTYLNLGDICIYLYHCKNKQEYVEKSLVYYENSLSIFTREYYPERWAMTQRCLSNVYQRIGGDHKSNFAKVVQCYQNALQVFTQQAFPEIHAETLRSLGMAYLNLQDFQAAYDAFAQAIDTVDNLRYDIISGDQVKRKLNEQWLHLYQIMVEVCIKLKRYDKALEYVDRSKTRNLVELLATRDLYPKGDIPQTVLDKLTDLRQNIETEQRRLEIEERNRDNFGGGTTGERSANITTAPTSPPDRSHLNQLQQQLDDLINREITPIDPDFRRTQKVQPMPFAEIQALTGENTAILEWYILSDRFLAFIVTPPTKPTGTNGETVTLWQSSKEDYNQLVKWADDYLNAYRNRTSQNWQNSLISRLQKLGEILHIKELMATIEKTAKKCDRLVLIPNRFLHLFPLHAIPISVSGGDITYLMDRFSGGVSYAPSCQLLQTANNRDRQKFSELFAIQNPTEDLEFTNLEVRRISTSFNTQTTLAKKQATKTELNSQQKTTLKTAHCHHFSCHGYFNFANPLLSALLLANCYLQPPPDPIDRSRHLPLNNNNTVDLSQCLTLGDVFTLDLVDCCWLVTLSACETGLIDILSKSDEYIGLPSGFLVAGSTNVVSSLWAVSDISTALLMIRFYEVFWEVKNVAIALNSAQNWLRNATKTKLLNWINPADKMRLNKSLEKIKDDKPFASPYYWGAFCAVGKVT